MGTYLYYRLTKGPVKHSGILEEGLQLLLCIRKATVRSIVLLTALLPLGLLLAFCGKVFFWIGLALLSANCGLWLAWKWMKRPWAVSTELHQVIVPKYIRTLTLPCYDRMDLLPTDAAGSRIFRSITGGLLGLFLGALAFPSLIPYRLWADISFLTLRLAEFTEYFQSAIECSEREKEEKEKRFEEEVAYYTGEPLFVFGCESANVYLEKPYDLEECLAKEQSFMLRYVEANPVESRFYTLAFGMDLIIDPMCRQATLKGEPLNLTRIKLVSIGTDCVKNVWSVGYKFIPPNFQDK